MVAELRKSIGPFIPRVSLGPLGGQGEGESGDSQPRGGHGAGAAGWVHRGHVSILVGKFLL